MPLACLASITTTASQSLVTFADLFRALMQRYEVFILHKPYTSPPSGGPNAKIDHVTTEAVGQHWSAVLGAPRVLRFENPKASVAPRGG